MHHNRFGTTLALAATAIVTTAAGTARGALLASETFSYATPNTIGAASSANAGGVADGWGAPWRLNATTLSGAPVNAASLSLPSGDAATPTGGSTSLTTEASAYRNLLSTLSLDANQDYYVGLLSRRAASNTSMAISLGAGGTALATFGFSTGGNRYVGTIGGTVTTTAGRPAIDATYYYVLKIAARASGNDQLFLSSFGADVPAEEPAAWAVTGTAAPATGTISRFTIATNSGLSFDEIRIGTTYADVVPVGVVPEPATAIVLAGGALLAARRRRI